MFKKTGQVEVGAVGYVFSLAVLLVAGFVDGRVREVVFQG